MKYLLRAALVAALVFGVSYGVTAQSEMTLVAPAGMKPPLDDLLPRLEKKTGHKIKPVYGSVGATRKLVLSGDDFDVAVVPLPDSDLLASGKIVGASATPLANVAVGAAVPRGAPKPDISTPDELKRALLAANSISYSDPAGGSGAGISFSETLMKLGIAEQVKPKAKLTQTGADAMAMVAKGKVEIGFIFMSEMDEPGIDVVGPLPQQVSPRNKFAGFVSSHAKNPAAAKALLHFLASPEASPAYKAHAMEPSR